MNNTTPENPPSAIPHPPSEPCVRAGERERVLTQRLKVPREQFHAWRQAGDWREGEHFSKDDSGAFVLTEGGAVQLLTLLHLETAQVPVVTRVALLFIQAGAMNRIARCRPPEGGSTVSVRLTGAHVFATKFRRGDRLEAVPTEVEGIYEYDGPAPRRMRL